MASSSSFSQSGRASVEGRTGIALADLRPGALLRCKFPYDVSPHRPGPQSHFCLLAESFVHEGKPYVIVAYGTSRMDDDLARAHPAILDVRPEWVRGARLKLPVTHILCDHLSLFPLTDEWVDLDFIAHLDLRNRSPSASLREFQGAFRRLEPTLNSVAIAVAMEFSRTGRLGLKPGSKLRRR